MIDPKNDPLGQALLDYLDGQTDAQLIIHSSITEDEQIPVAYFFREESLLPELEQKALRLCRGDVLDMGAGAGSHALVLQAQGLNVVALDISPGAVAVMHRRGVKIPEQGNVFDAPTRAFDTLLMLMNGIGLVGTLENLDAFLIHAKGLLRPDGQILLDSSDILYMFEEEDGSVLIDLNAGYYGEVTYQMEYKECVGEPFKWLFVDVDILQDHAEAQGYECELLLEDENNQFLVRLTLKK